MISRVWGSNAKGVAGAASVAVTHWVRMAAGQSIAIFEKTVPLGCCISEIWPVSKKSKVCGRGFLFHENAARKPLSANSTLFTFESWRFP
jgi:hypothetical protein